MSSSASVNAIHFQPFSPLTIIDKTRPFQLNWGSSLPTLHSTPFSVPCILYKLVVRSGGFLRNRTEYCVCVLTWFGFLARIHPVCLCDLSGCDWGVSWGFAGRDWPLRGEGWCEDVYRRQVLDSAANGSPYQARLKIQLCGLGQAPSLL